jgi:hypothetical protein
VHPDIAAECVCARCSQHTRQALLMQISEDVEREILNHRLLDHENIVRFHEVCSVLSHNRTGAPASHTVEAMLSHPNAVPNAVCRCTPPASTWWW